MSELPAELPNTKACPGCNVLIEKSGGGNHITCRMCKCHWCWLCRAKFDTNEECYKHLTEVHGAPRRDRTIKTSQSCLLDHTPEPVAK